uniref:Uncharacterized protein n=1 Tax=Tetradesmus obliquus TaxID=3088 RepID=A0A383WG29_TETOB|eukprot:jgi/Sobl393_1/1928/SZX76361.1
MRTPRGAVHEPNVSAEVHQAAAAADKLPGALTTAAGASTAPCNHGSRRSTGEKKVSIGPVITAVSTDGASSTQAIKAATADPSVDSPASHADTHNPAAVPAIFKPFVDDASLLTPVAEETLGHTSPSAAAAEAPTPDIAESAACYADEPAHPAAPCDISGVKHPHHPHEHLREPVQQELAQHCEDHAPGIESKRSSMADGRELRSTTSGQLHAATEHSIMSIAAASEHSSLAGEAPGDAINDEVSQSVLQGVPSAAVSRMPTSTKDIDDEEDEEAPQAEASQTPVPEPMPPAAAEAPADPQVEAAAEVVPAVEAAAEPEPTAEPEPAAEAVAEPMAEMPAVAEIEVAEAPAAEEVRKVAEESHDEEVAAEPEAAGEAAIETTAEPAHEAEPAADAPVDIEHADEPAAEAELASDAAPEAEASTAEQPAEAEAVEAADEAHVEEAAAE